MMSRSHTLLETYGQPFGGKGSQFNYIRDPEAMCAIARTWLAMLMSHYSDDALLIETQTTAEQAYHLWLELNQLIGWKIDMEKSPPPQGLMRLLGAHIVLNTPTPTSYLVDIKAQHLQEECRRHLRLQIVTSSDAASLRGKMGHARTFEWGRYGAAQLTPFTERQKSGRHKYINTAIRFALMWWICQLDDPAGRATPCQPDTSILHVTISDGEGTGSVAVAYWRPRDKHWSPIITQGETPEDLRAFWAAEKERDINEIEAIAPLLALDTFPELHSGLWLHFTDSKVALGTLVRGSSSVQSMNLITSTTWHLARQRKTCLWTEWLPTHDNPLDAASRRDLRDIWSQRWTWRTPKWRTVRSMKSLFDRSQDGEQ